MITVQVVLEWLKNQIYLLNCNEENKVINRWYFKHIGEIIFCFLLRENLGVNCGCRVNGWG